MTVLSSPLTRGSVTPASVAAVQKPLAPWVELAREIEQHIDGCARCQRALGSGFRGCHVLQALER